MENTYSPSDQSANIVVPKVDLQYITKGVGFQAIQDSFANIMANKLDKKIITEECDNIAKILRASFGIETTMAILSGVDSLEFFAFNVFPNVKNLRKIIRYTVDYKPDEIRKEWQQIRKWHIDVDGRMLFDPSVHMTAAEITSVLLYCIENVIFDYNTPIDIAYTITKYRTKMDYVSSYVAGTEKIADLYLVPFLVGCADTNFILAKAKDIQELQKDSIVWSNPYIAEKYLNAAKKITVRYGQGTLVDRSPFFRDKKINYILDWIYEGINDLKYSSLRLKENINRYMVACRSPYIRIILKQLVLRLSDVPGKVEIPHAIAATEGLHVNPAMKALNEKVEIDHWKNYVATQESKSVEDFLDHNGNMKKIEREKIDMIQVEAENITSVDDKIYLLDRLYKQIAAIETALDMLEDKKMAKRVKQSKNELLNLNRSAQACRDYIIKFKIQPERYGLFIKYPPGYEG